MTALAAPRASVSVLDAPDLARYPRVLRPRVAAPGVYYAGFWVRLGVNLVDSVLMALLYLVVNYVVQLVVGIIAGVAHFDSNAANGAVSLVCAVGVYVYYSTIVVARHSATPGMRFAGLRIVRADDITQAPERGTLIARGLIWTLFTATVVLRVIDALVIVVDERKRSLHDRMVGTAVVRRAPAPPRIASLLCDVCGRPVVEGNLCPKHGGSVGLAITLSGHTVSLQIAASLLGVIAVAALIVGIVFLFTAGLVVGIAGILVGIALLRVTTSLSQLREWARLTSSAIGLLIAIAAAGYGLVLLTGGHGTGGYLLAGAAVGALITGALWTPETYRSFRRVPT